MLSHFIMSWYCLTHWLGRLTHVAYGKACQLVLLSLSLRLGYCTNSRRSASRLSEPPPPGVPHVWNDASEPQQR